MTDTQEYNSWTNYATWNIHLWVSNDPNLLPQAQDACLYAPHAEQALEQFVRDNSPVLLETGWQSDILSHALSCVDWTALAGAVLESIS